MKGKSLPGSETPPLTKTGYFGENEYNLWTAAKSVSVCVWWGGWKQCWKKLVSTNPSHLHSALQFIRDFQSHSLISPSSQPMGGKL